MKLKYSVSVDGDKFDVEIINETKKGDERIFKVGVSGKEYEIAVQEERPAAMRMPTFSVAAHPAPPANHHPAKGDSAKSDDSEPGVRIEAPMAGKVTKVNVKKGDKVKQGEVLFILEAMKMENSIESTAAGVVASVSANVGDLMHKGGVMCVIAPEA